MHQRRFWFITFHMRKVTPSGPEERYSSEAISLHPAEFIHSLNEKNSGHYFSLIQAMPIDEELFKRVSTDNMRAGTRQIKRPNKNIRYIGRQ